MSALRSASRSDVARLRRLEESPALRVEARLKFSGDGEVGGKKSGRVHELPLLAYRPLRMCLRWVEESDAGARAHRFVGEFL